MNDVLNLAAARPCWYKVMRQKEKGPVEVGGISITIGWEERVMTKSLS
jgi:hypothetical protein